MQEQGQAKRINLKPVGDPEQFELVCQDYLGYIRAALGGRAWDPGAKPLVLLGTYFLMRAEELIDSARLIIDLHPPAVAVFTRILHEQTIVLFYCANVPGGETLAQRFRDFSEQHMLCRIHNNLASLSKKHPAREKLKEVRGKLLEHQGQDPNAIKSGTRWLMPLPTELAKKVDQHFVNSGLQAEAFWGPQYENLSEAIHGGHHEAAVLVAAHVGADDPEAFGIMASFDAETRRHFVVVAYQCIVAAFGAAEIPFDEAPGQQLAPGVGS